MIGSAILNNLIDLDISLSDCGRLARSGSCSRYYSARVVQEHEVTPRDLWADVLLCFGRFLRLVCGWLGVHCVQSEYSLSMNLSRTQSVCVFLLCVCVCVFVRVCAYMGVCLCVCI